MHEEFAVGTPQVAEGKGRTERHVIEAILVHVAYPRDRDASSIIRFGTVDPETVRSKVGEIDTPSGLTTENYVG